MLLIEMTIGSDTLYAGTDALADTQGYINPWIISASPMVYSLSQPYGGYCELTFGAVDFDPQMFLASGHWPAPISAAGSIYLVTGALADKNLLMTCKMHLKTIAADAVTYDIYDPAPDSNLLTEAADYDGNTVPLPRAFGTVNFVAATRLADDAVTFYRRYDLGHLQGTKHVHWHVYDDGIDVCSNVGSAADNVFTYTVTPVGEITLSGTGDLTSLEEIFTWAVGAGQMDINWSSLYLIRDSAGSAIVDNSGLPLWDSSYYSATSASGLSAWVTSQQTGKSWLALLTAYFRYMFFIDAGVLNLISMDKANGALALAASDYTSASLTAPAPCSGARAKWQTAASVSESVGQYVKRTDNEVFRQSAYTYGKEISIDPFQAAQNDIATSLDSIIAYSNALACEITLPLVPGKLPKPGMRLDIVLFQDLAVSMTARTIQYDYTKMSVTISGEATVA